MEFTIKNTRILKSKLRKIQRVCGEVAIKFKENGIKIMGMDSNNVLASQLFITKDNLVGYKYEPIKNIAINLNVFLIALKKLEDDAEFVLNNDSLSLLAANNKFDIGFMDLDSFYEFSDFEPKVEWKVNDNIEGINKIFTYMDNGPLIINSEEKGFKLDWIVAPKLLIHQ